MTDSPATDLAPATATAAEAVVDRRPLVISLCGTYLKREMQSLYRQIIGLKRFRTIVMTEQIDNAEMFPFSDIQLLEKKARPRPRGNFLLRFWYKHVVKQWPPPRPITTQREWFYYDLADRLRVLKPALVHVYYGHKAVKYLEMLKAWGGKFLVSFHGVDVVKFIDQPGYADQLRLVFAEAKLVLARSQSLLDRLRDLGCPPEKLRLNSTPIPLDDITPSIREVPSDGHWHLTQACRLIRKKGLFTLLEALAAVKAAGHHFTFHLCGSGPDEAALKTEATRLGLKEQVVFHGWMSQAQLRDLFYRSHLFLHPSELTESGDQEGVPNAMLEAMATGLPIVATTHGGIPEAVTSGQDGLLVPERSPQDLAAALITLMQAPNLVSQYSTAAATSVRQRYGATEQIAALEACYAEAAGVR